MKFTFLVSVLASLISLTSPDGNISVSIDPTNGLHYSVSYGQTKLLDNAAISMMIDDGKVLCSSKSRVLNVVSRSVSETVKSPIYKKASVDNSYNEKVLKYKNYEVVFRAYDCGVAYRFITRFGKKFCVLSESAKFNFAGDWEAWIPYVSSGEGFEKQFFSSFENTYTHSKLSEWKDRKIAFLPLSVRSPQGHNICITDADQMNYPGMFLNNNDGDNSLEGVWATHPAKWHQGGHNMLQHIVDERENYIARFLGAEDVSMPWRAIAISKDDIGMIGNDLVYLLATPASDTDWSWVRPGKVAWDWWNNWNIGGVDFKSGINNDTYKYYIDFAASKGIEYVILDEGWAVNKQADLFQVVPEIDLEELCAYAKQKGVGLILWAGYYAFDRDIEKVCRHYSAMGIKGFKVDFMDSDDQSTIVFLAKAAKIAAKYHLLLDFHGICKPAGLTRTYPNVINYEGIFGLEQMKWSKPSVDMVAYDVSVPFIRFVAGPADYTQGAMNNATRKNYRPCYDQPMSQGTRCHQLAEYVVFNSPLNMLCDSPTNYLAESECTDYIAGVPTVWDETIPLDGRIGEYVVVARRKAGTWYIAGMTNWDERDIEVDLTPLKIKGRSATVFQDGVNADRRATDYKKYDTILGNSIKLHLAPGGGFSIVVK